jgi:hypothetical protein
MRQLNPAKIKVLAPILTSRKTCPIWVRDMEVRRSSCVSEREACKYLANYQATQTGLPAIPQAAYCKVKSLYLSQIFIVELIWAAMSFVCSNATFFNECTSFSGASG